MASFNIIGKELKKIRKDKELEEQIKAIIVKTIRTYN